MSKDKPNGKREKDGTDDEPDKADVAGVVRRYYALLNELDPDLEALDRIVSRKLTQVEHPSAISPLGLSRGKRQLLADQAGSGDFLSDQSFEVDDILVQGGRAAVRGVWRGRLRESAGRLSAGTELVAHVAAFITVRDGKVVKHETFECYEPFISASAPVQG